MLAHVNSVANAVRTISQDLGEIPSDGDGEIQKMVKIKAKISATTNNLIIASKNFAISEGMSPISLLDAAASHPKAAVIHIVKIHPPLRLNEQLEDDDSSFIAESPANYGIDFGRSASGTESVYSNFNSPHPPPLIVKNSPAKHAYPARELPSRDGPPNGIEHGQSLSNASLGLGVQVHEELHDLKVPPPIPPFHWLLIVDKTNAQGNKKTFLLDHGLFYASGDSVTIAACGGFVVPSFRYNHGS